ncbi:MAG: MlaA family lipoprotein [Methylococcales bacterium]
MKTTILRNKIRVLSLFAVLFWLSGCATTGTDPRDPWEDGNRDVQSFNDGADKYVIKPIAEGYQRITPDVVDQGVTNFFNNVGDIRVTLNDFLQFKFGQGSEDFTRFLINTTLGVGGFVNAGSWLDFERNTKLDEDFDQTLGAWGMPTGPYMVLPLIGPSTARGILGLAGDTALNPAVYIGLPAVTMGIMAVKTTDRRADFLSQSKIADEASLDRYEFYRNAYLQRREYLIHDGNIPIDDDEEISDEELAKDAELGKEIHTE